MAYKKSDPSHPMNSEGPLVGKVVDIAKPKPRPSVPKRKKGVNCSTGRYATN